MQTDQNDMDETDDEQDEYEEDGENDENARDLAPSSRRSAVAPPSEMWRKQVVIVGLFAAGLIVVVPLDSALLAPHGGNWISLDFRGLFMWSYVAWALLHGVLTSVAVASGRFKSLAVIHVAGVVASGAVFAFGFAVLLLLS